jgi:8-oxo-dGTP diphosphatase
MKILTTCGAILLNAAGQVLIVRRSDTDRHRPLQWDLPGGHVEPGESLEHALEREVQEETSLDLTGTPCRLVYAVSDTFDDDNLSVTWLFFVAHIESSEIVLSDEHDQYEWVSVDQAVDLIEYDRKGNALAYARDNQLLG